MKKILFAVLLWPRVGEAAPYFRPIDISHPQPVFGALIDPLDLGQSEAVYLLPLITHSPKDGCLLPKIVCEDWTPISIGASMNSGKLTFVAAPLANVLPWMQAGARAITPEKWTGVQKILTSSGDQSVTFAGGPAWEYKQITNKGYFKIVTALALHF